jgi:hypothetical protein
MSNTTNLQFPLLAAAQAQKHVTVNEGLQKLDVLCQLAVVSRGLNAAPGSPADGARYLVGAAPTGAWSGQAAKIAAWQDGAWTFLTPREGWIVWIGAEDRLLVHDGTAWRENLGDLQAGVVTATRLTAGAGNYLVLDSVKSTAGDPAGAEGMLVINTADNAIRLYAEGAWRTLASW